MENMKNITEIKFEVKFIAEHEIVRSTYIENIGFNGIDLIRRTVELPNLDIKLIQRNYESVNSHKEDSIFITEETANELYRNKGYFANRFKIKIKVMGSEEDNKKYCFTEVLVDKDSNGSIEQISLKRKIDIFKLYKLWEDSNFALEITTVDITV